MALQNVQLDLMNAILSREEITGIHPIRNLAIYQNNVTQVLINTLYEFFPLINKLVGEDFFRMLAKEFIVQYPSRDSNLNAYGTYFSDFLADHPSLKHLPYLSEVAHFEWTCHSLYFAADATPFETTRLQSIDPKDYGKLTINLHPASALIKFYYPILKIIELCKEKQNETIDINIGGINLLIIRRELEIKLVGLEQADFVFLSCLQKGETLQIALQEAISINNQFDLEKKLVHWISNKTIVNIQ